MNVPQHIAIILDGNGRWAKSKGMPRNYGHAQGSKNVERICEEAWRLGIKYLTVYFKITNDVGDVRKTGYFKGTGPLKEGETASWDWDTSSYFTSGDSTTLSITKLVLTYMNGTTQVVSGKYIKFN